MKVIYLKKVGLFLVEGLEIDDLDDQVRKRVIQDHSIFLYEIEGQELEEQEIIDNIKLNGYLFDKTGQLLPITYYTKTNEDNTMSIIKTTIKLFGNEKEITIKE